MRTPPTNWTTLMAQQHETETRVDIDNGSGGVTSYYGYDGSGGIWSLATRNALFENFGAGNCHSGQIDITIVPQSAHFWKKSKVWYAEFYDTGETYYLYPEDEPEITLYKHIKGSEEVQYFPIVSGVDGITIPTTEIESYVAQGYRYTGDPNFVERIDAITWDADEQAFEIPWIQCVTFYETQEQDTEPFEGPDDGEVSSADPSAYPQYGAQGGAWYSYDGERAATIPTMAKMEVYVRLTNGTLATSWVRKGVYFIDTREWDAQHEFLTITGYDAMLKAEQPYYKPPVTITGWPKVDTAVVEEICTRLGVELDTRTVLNKGYMVQLPAVSTDGEGSDSLRTTLGYIGAAYGGNWIITDEGKLRLVPLKSTAMPIALGTNGIDLQTFPTYDALGIVHVVVSEEAEYVAGTDGRDIEISCPWGTQTMANNLLAALSGYVYQPLVITTEYAADPLYELGDNITFNGYTSVIAEENITFSLAYTADFSAPNGEEINHEYPYQDKGTQEIKRAIAKTRASFKIDIDRIEGKVDGKITTYRQSTVPVGATTGDLWYATADVGSYKAGTWYRYSGSAWEETSETASIPVAPAWENGTQYTKGDVVDDGGKWYAAKLNHTASSANKPPNATYWEEKSTISQVSSTQITQAIDNITLTATSGQNSSTIKIMANGIEVDSAVVTFAYIVADSIVANTRITSPTIYGGTIFGNSLYATGEGNSGATNPAFYMSDGIEGSGASATPKAPQGWLCYDKQGEGTAQEARNRVFLHSQPGVAMKLEAGGNMSLEANENIYYQSYNILRYEKGYGTSFPSGKTPENGTLFFII